MRKHVFRACVLAFMAGVWVGAAAAEKPAWVQSMKKVHAGFTGETGTFGQFGDSISDTMAFWTPLMYGTPRNMDADTKKDFELVKSYSRTKLWRAWKGGRWGNKSRMTVRWIDANVEALLKKMNPEVVVFLFGSNDLKRVPAGEYKEKLRKVLKKILDNGTVVILTTIPPFYGRLEKSKEYAEIIRDVGGELQVPVIDYMAEILKRRPDDWSGTLPQFAEGGQKGYGVLTLISGDGVHPSNPKQYKKDFSEEGLRSSGYTLRNYLTMRAYAAVIRHVLQAK